VKDVAQARKVKQLRVVVTADDYDIALRFYRDTLGLPELAAFSSAGGHVTILDAGRATLEITDPVHAGTSNAVSECSHEGGNRCLI
jgi:catechol 2,3-dioxygenase-like lactoylglutathione lyase family enzyme